MDELEKFLLSKTERTTDPEHLRMLGKQAAAEFIGKGTPLNDSIRDFSKEASLNAEQTKRVVEQANVSTFVHMFKKGYEENIEFPLADFDAINQEVPEETTKVSHYVGGAAKYVPGQEYVSLENVFGSDTEKEKIASEGWSAKDMHDYFEARHRIKHTTDDLSQLSSMFETQIEKVASAMHLAGQEGADPLEIVMLVKDAGVNRELMEVLLDKAASPKKTKALDDHPDLKGGQKTKLPDKVQAAILKKKLLNKRASDLSISEPNKEHPLFAEASALASLTNDIILKRDEIRYLLDNSKDIKRRQDLDNIVDRVL